MGSGNSESTTLIGGERDLPGTTSLLLCRLWFQTEVGMPAGSALRLIKPLASFGGIEVAQQLVSLVTGATITTRAALARKRRVAHQRLAECAVPAVGVAADRACDAGGRSFGVGPSWPSRNHARLLDLTVVLVSQSLGWEGVLPRSRRS